MANYTTFKAVKQKTEGFLSRNPQDTGGMTWKGIARKFHPNWPGFVIIDFEVLKNPSLSDKALSNILRSNSYLEELVDDFYRPIWNRIGANNFSQDLANLYMDWYIHKPADAVRAMQRILNAHFGEKLSVDGAPGNFTNSAVKRNDSPKLYNLLREERIKDYTSKSSSSPTFYQAWINRVKWHFPKKSVVVDSSKYVLWGAGILATSFLIYKTVPGEQRKEGSEAVN